MLGNESLWDVARAAHGLLADASVAHALVGGVAVCLHGYRRNTVDIDLVVRRDSARAARSALETAGWVWKV